MNKKNIASKIAFLMLLCVLIALPQDNFYANDLKASKTSVNKSIEAVGQYINWDGVSNVSQFLDKNNELCFAYDNGKYVSVIKTKNGKQLSGILKLKKKAPLYGAITCDPEGNYYIVTGRENSGTNTNKKTVFITRYDESGKETGSVGDNGNSSGLFYTKLPFYGGNCDIAVNGDYVAVNYARLMYSDHQSNSLILINKQTMEKFRVWKYYNSHSFAQRVIPFQNRFLLASEGDCYSRAFSVALTEAPTDDTYQFIHQDYDIFHFWVKKGTLDNWDMGTLNDNFAHMGGVAQLNNQQAALVATSAKSLNKKAAKENEQLFIQIFDPTKDLDGENGLTYITSGVRSGLSGENGTTKVEDFGVKWLTNYSKSYTIENPQVVSTDNGKYVILFERYKNYNFQGVFSVIVDSNGKVVQKVTKISKTAYLNPCRIPVYSNGCVSWVGNKYGSSKNSIYIYRYAVK